MRILVDFRLDRDVEPLLINDNVIYRPDLEKKDFVQLGRAIKVLTPDAVITKRPIAPADLVDVADQALCIIHLGAANASVEATYPPGIQIRHVDPDVETLPEVKAFELAEMACSGALCQDRRRAEMDAINIKMPADPAKQTVLMVGAGIVNLVVAYYLVNAGYRVAMVDAGPRPGGSKDWMSYGCTFGGENARMFSMSETRHHLNKGYMGWSAGNLEFNRHVSDAGWKCCHDDSLSPADWAWIKEYQSIPSWLPTVFNREIISFNQESWPLWESMRRAQPDLFNEIGYIHNILRLYSTPTQYERALEFEAGIGSLLSELSLGELVDRQPALKDAVEAGSVAGAINAVGFTVNIHRFAARLIGWLERRGVVISWGHKVDRIRRDDAGRVVGLEGGGRKYQADHYVISPGAYGNGLLAGTASEGKIASVAGMWLRIPNQDPALTSSLKITRHGFAAPGAAEGANVIVGKDEQGRPIIHVSSGHGYVGSSPGNLSREHLKVLFSATQDTAEKFFPTRYRAALDDGLIDRSFRYCIRPWTASGLGVFERIPTRGGGSLVIAAGHNTGGFAQCPSVAQAVLAALGDAGHAMHRVYHPRRVDHFLELDSASPRRIPEPV